MRQQACVALEAVYEIHFKKSNDYQMLRIARELLQI
jgi:hypothetical protein